MIVQMTANQRMMNRIYPRAIQTVPMQTSSNRAIANHRC